jgi:hypothetical protein
VHREDGSGAIEPAELRRRKALLPVHVACFVTFSGYQGGNPEYSHGILLCITSAWTGEPTERATEWAADTGDMVAPGCTMLSLMLRMVQGRGSVVEDT